MKKKIVCGLLLAGVMMFCVGGCGKDEVVQNPTEVVEHSETDESESSEESPKDKWYGEHSEPSKSEEPIETEEPTVSTEPSESEEPTEPSKAEDPTETPEPTETENTSIVTEDDLVRVVVPELNKESQDYVYNTLATYRVEGDITINENINYGVKLESDNIKKLITLIYEGTGCTSHKVIEETFAIYDTDPYDYSAYIELSDGSKYALYLVNDTCYAIADTY